MSSSVHNTGNVTVSGVEIDETLFSGTGALGEITCPDTTLDADEEDDLRGLLRPHAGGCRYRPSRQHRALPPAIRPARRPPCGPTRRRRA